MFYLSCLIDHPYASFLSELERPGRYVGGEYGEAEIPENADLRLVLAYPDSYEIGMSHIGLSVLYETVNSMPSISAERAFMPWPDLESALKKHGIPLVSLETARPLCDFDIIGFSLQYELTYTNLLAMLSLGGIPKHAEGRSDGDPIVLVGGPLAIHCEPIAPFVDLCLVGDGEEALPELLLHVAKVKQNRPGRKELLKELNNLPSVFVPALLERIYDSPSKRVVVKRGKEPAARRAIVPKLGDHLPGLGPVPTVGAVFDRYSVEVARGCTAGCRFCQAGFLYRPVRERTEVETLGAVERAVACLGFDEISLAALSTADHSRIGPIISSLGNLFTPQRVSLSVPSLRAYGLPSELVEVLARLRATGVTLAPEAGSQRMRDTVNKNVEERDLTAAAARFFDWGFTRIKLYFMIGLPGETDEDIAEIVELSHRLRNFGRQRLGGRNPSVTISVSTFVPKPFTPFEREEMVGLNEIRRRQAIVAELGKKRRLGVKLHDPRLSLLEGILCRGDSRLAPLLLRAFDLGARFDGWSDMFNEKAWQEVLAELDIQALQSAIPDYGRLPWDHVGTGIDPKFLRTERDRASVHKTTEPCGRFADVASKKAVVVCHGCGLACPPSSLPIRAPRPATSNDIPPPSPVRGKPRPRAFVAAGTGDQMRVRLFYAKWGRQAFVGHLDTMRHVTRSLRRAGLELVYTQGFHPKPKIESAPPLPLGTAGLMEPLDVFLVSPPDEEEILSRLKNTVPSDFEFKAARKIPKGEKSLSKLLDMAEYLALVSVEPDRARTNVKQLLAAQSIEVERTRKGRTEKKEIRPFLVKADVLEEVDLDWQIPLREDRSPISLTLALPPSGGARAIDLLETAFGQAASSAWVARTRFISSQTLDFL